MVDSLHHLALAWLEKARHDLETARRVIAGDPPITDTAVYHCQQAAEKALKAILLDRGQQPFKTHDLMVLLAKCADGDPAFMQWIDAAATLTPYATHFRYPCAEPDPGLEETLEAMRLSTALYEFVDAKLLAGSGPNQSIPS